MFRRWVEDEGDVGKWLHGGQWGFVVCNVIPRRF